MTARARASLVLAGLAASAGLATSAWAQDERLTVAAFGTSLTSNGGWQSPLAEAIEACTGMAVTVGNHGKAGAASDWGVEAVGEVAASRPDLVFLEFAANDADAMKWIMPSASVANMRTIVEAFRATNPKVVVYVMTMNPFAGPRSWIRPFRSRYENAHRDLARDLGVFYLDHRPAWEALPPDERYLAITDGVHPTQAAATAVVVPGIMARLRDDGVVRCRDASRAGR